MLAEALKARVLAPATELLQPPPGLEFDFSQPAGEAALVAPDSMSWRIFKNPVSLFIGGVAAVILELAEPSVRSGVWNHSTFRKDAVTRLRRTGAAAMMTVYGPRSAAERMIAHVVRMHDHVTGTTPDGRPYNANDQCLLDWVQATASYGFIEAYSRFASPLSEGECSQAFAEGAEAARLYGALGAPQSPGAWRSMLRDIEPRLEPSAILLEFLDIMRHAPVAPAPLRPVQRLLIAAAIDLVPEPLRQKLGLEHMGLSLFQRNLVCASVRLADRVAIPDAPPAQSCLRLGLPADYLYRRH